MVRYYTEKLIWQCQNIFRKLLFIWKSFLVLLQFFLYDLLLHLAIHQCIRHAIYTYIFVHWLASKHCQHYNIYFNSISNRIHSTTKTQTFLHLISSNNAIIFSSDLDIIFIEHTQKRRKQRKKTFHRVHSAVKSYRILSRQQPQPFTSTLVFFSYLWCLQCELRLGKFHTRAHHNLAKDFLHTYNI